jgi:hypothetical protein
MAGSDPDQQHHHPGRYLWTKLSSSPGKTCTSSYNLYSKQHIPNVYNERENLKCASGRFDLRIEWVKKAALKAV